MILSYRKFVLIDLIAKAFTHKKAFSKGADCSCITVAALGNCQLRPDFTNQTGFREGIIPSYLRHDV